MTDARSVAERLDEVVELLGELVENSRPPSPVLDRKEFAALLKIGVSTFDADCAKGIVGPQPTKLGGVYRWDRNEVMAWLKEKNSRGEYHDATTWPVIWATRKRSA